MKECKCGQIPPCYSGRVFNIYEEAKKVKHEWDKTQELWGAVIDKMRAKLMEGGFADDTHDKVYELNRQMCDIDKHLSEAGYFRMICDGQIETRKKLIDMEEKKTKKMTKAEAFEWLKGKKVNTIGLGEEVQKKLFGCGVSWRSGECEYYDFSDYLLIDADGQLFHCGCDEGYWRMLHFEEIYAHDILSMEIIDENKSEEEKALDKISCLGAQIVDILLHMKGHHHVAITETDVILYDEGMSLFHSDPF